MSATTIELTQAEYKVADLALAEWGRKEIAIKPGISCSETWMVLRPHSASEMSFTR